VGHAVVESIHNALQQWCTSHHRNVNYTLKGQNCFTEMYSAIEAEVPIRWEQPFLYISLSDVPSIE
jgi:hypothetical protein